MIFGLTSVFPNQRSTLTGENVEEIRAAAAAIVNQASTLVSAEDLSHSLTTNHRYMLFPLFLAGIESREMTVKQWVANILTEFEKTSIGRNVEVASRTLLEIYDLQQQLGAPAVDWIDHMTEKLGCRAVIYDI